MTDKPTQFSEFVDTYSIDKKSGRLVNTGEVNRQKEIDAEVVNCYEAQMLAQQQYEALGSPEITIVDSDVQVNNFYGDLLDLEDLADELRQKYNLDSSVGIGDVFDYLEKEASKNEAQTYEESESEELPQNGEEVE